MTIKRRIDTSKLRRPLKRSKITESVYGSLFIYIKFFVVWVLVLTADFLLEFRFEYLWPFWLLMRSAYDSFKYQGLVFSLLFLALALCSDVICLMILPIHWLFFAASTYVWVQFVWHTDRGLGLPTISMWLLFIYVEASVRLKELKNLPFHLDLCRPFAAHCIGYPVVTLGYGVKSYVGYKIRQRKIQQVSKENDFYMELINQSLPAEQLDNAAKGGVEKFSDDSCSPRKQTLQTVANGVVGKSNNELLFTQENGKSFQNEKITKANVAKMTVGVSPKKLSEDHNLNELENRLTVEQEGRLPNGHTSSFNGGKKTSPVKNGNHVNHCEENEDSDSEDSSNTSSSSCSAVKKEHRSKSTPEPRYRPVVKDVNPVLLTQLKEEKNARQQVETKLNQTEYELKRQKLELQSSRQTEQDIRSQLQTITSNERTLKSELHQLKNDNEIYQQKIQTMSSTRQQDRNSIATLERKLKSERDARQLAETQLREERKKAKADETAFRRDDTAVHEHCSARRVELENSLSSETRLKLDLFSALGEARRRLEISQGQLIVKDQEINSLKAKIAEVMAVMPLSSNGDTSQVYGSHPITPPLTDHDDLSNGSVYIPKAKNGLL